MIKIIFDRFEAALAAVYLFIGNAGGALCFQRKHKHSISN